MEIEEDKLCEGLEVRTLEENTRIEGTSTREQKLVWDQWQQIEKVKGRDIKSISIVENLGIWSKIVEVEDKKLIKEGELNKMNHQKRIEVSRLLVALL